MQIVTVHKGDTVWEIANRFGVRPADVIRVNGLNEKADLVIGQSLVVPTLSGVHVVQSGDTFWSIAQQYHVTVEALQKLNYTVNPQMLSPGTRIYLPQRIKRTIESNGYLQPSTVDRDQQIVRETNMDLTYFTLFSYQVQPNGHFKPLKDSPTLKAINKTKSTPMVSITNFTEGNFSPEVAHSIFTKRQVRERLIANVINLMRIKGYQALNIDFENLREDDRDAYTQFIQLITQRVKRARSSYLVSTALAPKTSAEQKGAWYTAHDYPAHGRIVDFVILMTYEWGWSGGAPMAVSPIPQMRKVLDYATQVIPPNKILMGGSIYGYDWTLPYVKGGPFAKTLSPQGAVNLARVKGAEIHYDQNAEAPYFHYYDGQKKEHVVWFEDARSIQAKFDLIREYRLRGISYWLLGREFPQNWTLLTDNFNIRKLR
ncbi:spore germination protein [Marininema mesophilum]|uniref:Spore germination protein n=1 Tax=Marininema mesophilum TaxID=1048340 RepID=A0A1H2U679_9BACL|nr:LysM peptidoglycan-binding domain-containing protein [Marininema mesophilum]SDW51378.1 spore germination protein [Marininema mesophilum]